MADEIKLCKDCAHFMPDHALCAKDKMPPDYVFGHEQEFYPAQAVRTSRADCGPEARWFEPKAAA